MKIFREIVFAFKIFFNFYKYKRYDFRIKEQYKKQMNLTFHEHAFVSVDSFELIRCKGESYVGAYAQINVLNENGNKNNSFLYIGKGSSIGEFSNIRACGGKIEIGDNVQVSQSVHIIASNHGTNKNLLMNKQAWDTKNNFVIIKDDVWIGCNTVILPGTTIEKGAIIGAGSVVKGNIPEYAIAAGVPAKVIKFRE